MKRLLIYLTLILSSCISDSEIYDSISPTVFPKNESDAESLVFTAYNLYTVSELYQSASGGIVPTTELVTDIGNCQWVSYWLNLLDLQMYPFVNEYTKFYDRLNHMSLITMDIDLIEKMDIQETKKALFVAELKCLRAWGYYILYDLYGTVPLIPLEIIDNPLNETLVGRSSVSEMVGTIEKDLLDALPNLPYKASDYGRATKGLANMLLLKLYMHEKNWKKSEETARELMKPEYGYGLMDSYASIFTLDNEKNKEIIHASVCDRTIGHSWYAHILPYDYPGANPNYTKWGGYRIDWHFYNTFEPNDDRKSVICAEYVSDSDGTTYNQQNPGSQLTKGAVPLKYGDDMECTGTSMQIDWVIFRYADVLLSLSEAIANGSSGVNQEAIDLVNQIRIRAKLNPVKLEDYIGNSEKFNELLLLERGHELFFEGHRRSDLIRFGKYIDVMKKKENGRLQVHDYNVLFPIPQSAINESKGILVQNPGY